MCWATCEGVAEVMVASNDVVLAVTMPVVREAPFPCLRPTSSTSGSPSYLEPAPPNLSRPDLSPSHPSPTIFQVYPPASHLKRVVLKGVHLSSIYPTQRRRANRGTQRGGRKEHRGDTVAAFHNRRGHGGNAWRLTLLFDGLEGRRPEPRGALAGEC